MRKTTVVCALLLALVPLASFAQGQDLFSAGAWEFGGSFMYTAMPSNPIFDDNVTAGNKKDTMHIIEPMSAPAGLSWTTCRWL